MQEVFDFLDGLGIPYKRYDHPPVFTVEDARVHRPPLDFWENKNLFLRNRKGDKHFLVTLEASKRLDLIQLGNSLGEKVGFASPERLLTHLNLTPGSVSPFGLLNDKEHTVVFVLDSDALKHERIGMHPNINTQTLVMSTSDFLRAVQTLCTEVLIREV